VGDGGGSTDGATVNSPTIIVADASSDEFVSDPAVGVSIATSTNSTVGAGIEVP